MSKALYAQYLKERENAEILERPWGFAVYKWAADHVYLQDIYVIPEKRKGGFGIGLMQAVANEARAKGIETMYGSIDPLGEFSTSMMSIMINLGFKLSHNSGGLTYLKKNLKDT